MRKRAIRSGCCRLRPSSIAGKVGWEGRARLQSPPMLNEKSFPIILQLQELPLATAGVLANGGLLAATLGPCRRLTASSREAHGGAPGVSHQPVSHQTQSSVAS